jgi:hypothetical protein
MIRFALCALALVSCTPRVKQQPAAATAVAPTAPPVATAAPTATVAPTPSAAPPATATVAAPPALLAPLVGIEARRAEVRAIVAELIAQLPAAKAAKMKVIPLVFDPDGSEINAFAGCEKGAPYLAATEGFLLAVDAIAQTRATDERFGTKTYEAYASTVAKRLENPKGGGPGLPAGSIPVAYANDPQRLSRAREIFDDIVAFAFGHELAHHHLGHTGCANGQVSAGPNPAVIGHLVTMVIPGLNQPTEIAADTAGCFNTLDAGRARRPLYAWSEQGGLWLFDFFGRLEANAPLLTAVGFLRTHPDSRLRAPIVKAAANAWRAEQPK